MSSHHFSIVDKVAIITGASSGIGRGVAINFAGQGCRLAITGRDEKNLEETKALCVERGLAPESVLMIVADMMKNDDVERIMAETVASFGQLDILINNAGIVIPGSMETYSMDSYHQQMQVNVHSLVLLTKLAVPYLEKTKGSIVNVSSVISWRPGHPRYWAYTMTKAALDQFCRSLSLELAPKGIRVNNVNPGVILTNIQTQIVDNEEEYQQLLEDCATAHALKRSGDVSEVASVISFLVSDRSD